MEVDCKTVKPFVAVAEEIVFVLFLEEERLAVNSFAVASRKRVVLVALDKNQWVEINLVLQKLACPINAEIESGIEDYLDG